MTRITKGHLGAAAWVAIPLVPLLSLLALPSSASAETAKHGIVVVRAGGPTDAPPDDAAWQLAKAIYARPALRPDVDEPTVEALIGEAPLGGDATNRPHARAELAEVRAAIQGDDAPSRRLLAGLVDELHVQGIVVLLPGSPVNVPVPVPVPERTSALTPPVAQLFSGETRAFEPARYVADANGSWSAAVASIEALFPESTASPPRAAPAVFAPPTTAPTRTDGKTGADEKSASRPFYASPWFWGALAGAALVGTGVYFLAQDSRGSTIHLQLSVPR